MGRKKKQIELEESEHSSLLHNSKYHAKAEVREKCQAILLNHSGLSQKDVARHLRVSEVSICHWIQTWKHSGLAGLCRKSGQGRKPILSIQNTEHNQLIEKVLQQQSQSIKSIQAELVKELSVDMSTDTVKRYLKKIVTHGEESVAVLAKGKTKRSTKTSTKGGKLL